VSLRRAVLCSRNRHKARELERLLPGWEIEPLDRGDYPPETGATYVDNARSKARFGREHAAGWLLAEDSGLEVETLGGRPGVESARYAPEGAPAIAKLLAELGGDENRAARYVSELVALAPDGSEHRGTGTLPGRIAHEPRGSEGFGYDPVFVPEGEERTVAELGDDWKERNSHRARAARALLAALGGALLLAACGGSSPPSVERTFARFLAGPDGATWAARFPHQPGSRPCTTRDPLVKKVVAATCSTALSLEKKSVLATFTVSWAHGSRVRAWLVFLRNDGRIASISREGSQ